MDKTKLFPIALIALQFAAAIPYTITGKTGHAIYWIAAGVLNIAVTFMM